MRNFTIIPNQIFEQSQLSVPARYLYCVLLKYCGKDEWCFPSQITLGGVLGYTPKYIRKLLNELIDVRLISKKRRGWNKPNTYHVVKLLDTDRIPSSDTNREPSSALLRTSSSPQSGSIVPIHNKPAVPPKSTYLKGKDKRSLKGLEKMRKDLVVKGILKPTTIVIKPKLNEYRKHLKVTNKFTN